MINITWWEFLLVVFSFFTFLNMIFALIYFVNGVEFINSKIDNTLGFKAYLEAFYFSVQTFTTVGFGGLSPVGTFTNLVASLEMLTGIITVAIVTGVAYGKFSKPKAKILFSNNALISPYKEGVGLMFRIANIRRSQLMEVNVKVILSFEEKLDDGYNRFYHPLELERDKVMFFPLSWTIVHPIDENNPIHSWKEQDLIDKKAEILIQISGHDETYHQEVYQRYSYTAEQIVVGAKFDKAFEVNSKQVIEFDLKKVHKYNKVDLPKQ